MAKTSILTPETPAPLRFFTKGDAVFDLRHPDAPVFFRGMGYSPYRIGENPLKGAAPKDDGRFSQDLSMMKEMGVNYLHVFPRAMPTGFFQALTEKTLPTARIFGFSPILRTSLTLNTRKYSGK